MRILVVSAHYPPYHLGGYEIRNRDIVESLARKGHEVLVITSRKKRGPRPTFAKPAYAIHRSLHVRGRNGTLVDKLAGWKVTHAAGMFLKLAREVILDLNDLAFVDSKIEDFRPDVVYLGHVTNLSKGLLPYLAGTSIVYDEGGGGLIHVWTDRGIWYKLTDEHVPGHIVTKALKSLVVAVVCQLSGSRLMPQWVWPRRMRVFFNSAGGLTTAAAQGVPLEGAKVIHSGVDLERFRFRSRSSLGTPVRIIMPGRIEPKKGQVDGVRLLARLRDSNIDAEMTFAGGVESSSYHEQLIDETKRLGLDSKVCFVSMVPQSELANLYSEFSFCFFATYWRGWKSMGGGFSRVPLEAMASGCIVISYGNEGSDEIIRDGQNGFLVPMADFARITDIVKDLLSNTMKVMDITLAARRDVEENHSMQRYIDQIEAVLTDASRGSQQ
jgi:glycosyltransferase involved in cell wall biosynthesis